MRKNPLWILILTAFLVSLPVRNVVTASSKPLVSLNPKISMGSAGTTITINVTVTNVTAMQALYSYDINLTFNPAILNCTDVEEGPFLGTAGATRWFEPVIRNDKGYVLFGASLFWMMPPPPPGASGNGTLGTVTFDVLVEGRSPLIFSMTALNTLVEDDGAWISVPIVHDSENGVFTILGDGNGDGLVDTFDLFDLGKAYESHGPDYNYPGEPPSSNWNANCDFNKDNKVDNLDLSKLSQNYGKDC